MPELTAELFRAHLADTQLWPEGRVLVGYSGGADSACLVHLLATRGIDFVAGHLHHGQRAEADAEAESCATFCEQLGVSFVSGKADVPAISKSRKVGLEEAGRLARYEFFDQACRAMGLAAIATAHTRTDHVETVLLHMIRGCGLRGLGGIRESAGGIIRPLLPFDREQTRQYCVDHGLWFHDDPANVDTRFSRSRLRLDVLPALQQINPSVLGSIASLAKLADEEDAFLDAAAAAGLEQAELDVNGELAFLTRDIEVIFDRNRLRHLPVVLLRRAIRLCVEVLGGALDHPVSETAAAGIRSESTGSVTAEGGDVSLRWSDKVVHFERAESASIFRELVNIPGELVSAEGRWRLAGRTTPYNGQTSRRDGLHATIDFAGVCGQLTVRPAEGGDELIPLGFDHHRKVSDLLSEAKLTQAVRRRLPVVVDESGPIWIPGVVLASRAATSGRTKTVLNLVFESASPESSSSNYSKETTNSPPA